MGERLAVAGFAIAVVVLAPLWFPLHLIDNGKLERRGRRILRRTEQLPAVQLDIADGDLVLQPDRKVGRGPNGLRPMWNGSTRIPLSDLTRGDWWSLDEDGSFAAANAPPTEIMMIETRTGDKIEVCVSWDDWNAHRRVVPLLRERGILPQRPSLDGRRPGLHGFTTATGFVLTLAMAIAACAAIAIATRC